MHVSRARKSMTDDWGWVSWETSEAQRMEEHKHLLVQSPMGQLMGEGRY